MSKELEIGKSYWIFSGTMETTEEILTAMANEGRTAIFSSVPRKTSSVYFSKEEALRIGNY